MIDLIPKTMRQDLVKDIAKNINKIAIIIEECTSIAKDRCPAVYIRSVLNSSPVNIFLNMVELWGQDANSICNWLLDSLQSNGLDNEYLAKNLIAFTSDGASVMMGAIKGVAIILKSKYAQIVLWHCLNHRLELAVSDTIKAVDGIQPIEDLFGKIYAIYPQSAKLRTELISVTAIIEVQLRKVGKILTPRWVASSSWAVESFWRNYLALYKHFFYTVTVYRHA